MSNSQWHNDQAEGERAMRAWDARRKSEVAELHALRQLEAIVREFAAPDYAHDIKRVDRLVCAFETLDAVRRIGVTDGD